MKPCCCNRCSVRFSVILLKCARPSTRTGEFVALKPVCTFHFSNSDSLDHTTVFASEKEDGGVSGSSSQSASSLHARALTCICDELCSQTIIPGSAAHRAVILTTESFLLLMQCQLRAQRSQVSTTDCWPHLLRFPQILKLLPHVLQITRSPKSSELCVEEHYSEIFLQFVDSETLAKILFLYSPVAN